MDQPTRRRFARYFAAQHVLSDQLYAVAGAFLWQLHVAQLLDNQLCRTVSNDVQQPRSIPFHCNNSAWDRLVWTVIKAPKVLLLMWGSPVGACYLAHLLVICAAVTMPPRFYLKYARTPVLVLARLLPGVFSLLACSSLVDSTNHEFGLVPLQSSAYWSEGLHFLISAILLPVTFKLQVVATAMKGVEMALMTGVCSLNFSGFSVFPCLVSLGLACMFSWYWEAFQFCQFLALQGSKPHAGHLRSNMSLGWALHDELHEQDHNGSAQMSEATSCSCSSMSEHWDSAPSSTSECGPSIKTAAACIVGSSSTAAPTVQGASCTGGPGSQLHLVPECASGNRVAATSLATPLRHTSPCLPTENARHPTSPLGHNAAGALAQFQRRQKLRQCTAAQSSSQLLVADGSASPPSASLSSSTRPRPSALYSSTARVCLLSVKIKQHPREFANYAAQLQSSVQECLPTSWLTCSSVVVEGCVQLLMWTAQPEGPAGQDALQQQALELFNNLPAVNSKVPDVDIHLHGHTFCFRNGAITSVTVEDPAGGPSSSSSSTHPMLRAAHTPMARCCVSPASLPCTTGKAQEPVEVRVLLEMDAVAGQPALAQLLEQGLRVVVQAKGDMLADATPSLDVVGAASGMLLVACSVWVVPPRDTCQVHIAVLSNKEADDTTAAATAAAGTPMLQAGRPIASTSILVLPEPAAQEVLQLHRRMLDELGATTSVTIPTTADLARLFQPAAARQLPGPATVAALPVPAACTDTAAAVCGAPAGGPCAATHQHTAASCRQGTSSNGTTAMQPTAASHAAGTHIMPAPAAFEGGQDYQADTPPPAPQDSQDATPSTPGMSCSMQESALEEEEGMSGPGMWEVPAEVIHDLQVQLCAWESHFLGFVQDFAQLAHLQVGEPSSSWPEAGLDPKAWAPGGSMEQLMEFMAHHSMWDSLQVLLGCSAGGNARVGRVAVQALQRGLSTSSVRLEALQAADTASQGEDGVKQQAPGTAGTGGLSQTRRGTWGLLLDHHWSILRAGAIPLQVLGGVVLVRKARVLGISDVALMLLPVLLVTLPVGHKLHSRSRLGLMLQMLPSLGLLLLTRHEWSGWQTAVLATTMVLQSGLSVLFHVLGLVWLPYLQSTLCCCLAAVLLHLVNPVVHTQACEVPCMSSDTLFSLFQRSRLGLSFCISGACKALSCGMLCLAVLLALLSSSFILSSLCLLLLRACNGLVPPRYKPNSSSSGTHQAAKQHGVKPAAQL